MKRKIFTLLIVVIAVACSLTLTACGGVSQDVHEDYTNVTVEVPIQCKDISAKALGEGYQLYDGGTRRSKTNYAGISCEIVQKNLYKGQDIIVKVNGKTYSEYYELTGPITLKVTFYGVDGEEETKTIKVKR